MLAATSLKISIFMGTFCPKHKKFYMNKYRGLMSHDTEE